MGEKVVIASMRDASEAVADAKVADVKALFDTHVNDGKIVLVVEGPDDKEVYEGLTNSSSVCIYVVCNCEKHFVILDALNDRYRDRLLAIKDADFDRLEGKHYSYSNLVLTDTHDMEGMIVESSLSSLEGEDAERCQDIKLADILQLMGTFDDEIVIENKVNGVIQSKTYKKWQLVASHTARRTFVTVNVMRGVAEHQIRRASGHRSVSGFLKYIRYQEESGALCGS